MKKIMILLGLCLITGGIFAQQKGTFLTDDIYYRGFGYKVYLSKMLNIGDKMPKHVSTEVFNTREKSIDLASYTGKLLILDFWFSGCGSCIAAFPEMQKLQNQFNDKIKIVLVSGNTKLNGDNEQKLQRIIDYTSKMRGIKIDLPCILRDTTLDAWFANTSNPHEVWIGPSGKIIAITGASEVTSENIQAVLDGKEVNFKMKYDFINTTKPLFIDQNRVPAKDLISYSAFTGYAPWMPVGSGGLRTDSNGYVIGLYKMNTSLLYFYNKAYPDIFKNIAGYVYETKDSLRFKGPRDVSNLFCYDATFPPINMGPKADSLITLYLKQDLEKNFNYLFKRTNRVQNYISVSFNNNINKIYSKESDGKQKRTFLDAELRNNNLNGAMFKDAIAHHKVVFSHGLPMSHIRNFLSEQFELEPVFDKIGNEIADTKKLDLDFPFDFDFNDKEKLKKYLSSKGIDLNVEKREVDIVVIGDRKENEATIKL